MPKIIDSKTILLIEDDHGLRSILALLLENLGHRVFEAADAAEARAVWSQRGSDIDTVVSDILLPDASGPDVVQEFCKAAPELMAVFISGAVPQTANGRTSLTGNFPFVQKPFTPRTLEEAINPSSGESLPHTQAAVEA
jgi:two-component system cell cycle sensor histidine kinase/response regulator CckA